MIRFDGARKGVSAILVLGLAVAGTLGMSGCAGDDDEGTRNIVQILSVNNNLPLLADLHNYGSDIEDPTDDYIPIDYLTIQFQSRAHDPALTLRPDRAFGSVTFSRYTIDYTVNDLDGDGTEDISDLDLPMNALIPAGGLGQGAVLAVPAGWKLTGALYHAWLVSRGYNDPETGHVAVGDIEFVTDAKIVLYGEEETSHDKIVLEAGIAVGFADYADE